MLQSTLEPNQILKAIADLVTENQVLKKECELLRAQLDHFRTQLDYFKAQLGGTSSKPPDLRNPKRRLPSDLLTPQETAEYLNISPGTLNVWRCTHRQEIPYTKVGRSVRYRVADLEAFLFRSERLAAARA